MVFALLIICVVGAVAWFQTGKVNSPEIVSEQFLPAISEGVSEISTTTPTSTYASPEPEIIIPPTPRHRLGETVDECIQIELDLGQSDANEIFKRCLPEAVTPSP